MFEKIQRVSSVGVTVLTVCVVAGGAGALIWSSPYPWVAGALVGAYFLFAIKVAPQWEKVALLRFGARITLYARYHDQPPPLPPRIHSRSSLISAGSTKPRSPCSR